MADSAKFIPTVEGSVKTHATFNMIGTVGIDDSLNVSSLIDSGVGLPEISYINPFFNNKPCLSGSGYNSVTEGGGNASAVTNGPNGIMQRSGTRLATKIDLDVRNGANASTNGGNIDLFGNSISINGKLA